MRQAARHDMTHPSVSILVFAAILALPIELFAAARHDPAPGLRVTILFNNVPYRYDVIPGWGFSCLVEGLEKTILFDTGSNGAILLANMNRVNHSPSSVKVIALSHIHADHTGGIAELLAANPDVEVFLPSGFPVAFRPVSYTHLTLPTN